MATELCVGATGVVRGNLPRRCRLAARFDRAAGVIRIDSPELDSFSIIVHVSKLHERSPTYEPTTTDVLEREARLMVKYDADAGELRYQSPDAPEFWVEVDVQQIMQSKRQKLVAAAAGDAAGGAAWETHLATIKAELHLMHRPWVDIQHGESNNSFDGAEALLDEIERKGAPVHIVLKYLDRDIVVQFYTEVVAGKFQMPVLRFHCYTADAEVAESVRLRVVFSCIDDTRMESVECIVAHMSKWPDGDKMIYDIKTAHALYNDDIANGEDEATGCRMQLCLNIRAMHASQAPNTCDAAGACKQLHDEFSANCDSHFEACQGVRERRFDCDEDVYMHCRNWLKAFACYTDGSAPPLAPRTPEAYVQLVPYMKQTIVYYYESQSSVAMLERYLRERLPCAMGRHILTDTRTMQQEFGFDTPLYRSLEAPPPVIGIFTRAPVRVGQEDVELSIYHMIAPDLCAYADRTPTADLRALIDRTGNAMATDRLMYEAARMHAIVWYLAFAAAHEHGFTKLADVLVGGGAFVPEEWHESFKVKVHDTALYLIGYGADDFRYPEVELVPPPARVPLRDATGWHDVLHVNAWCHSSFLGNGNRVDGTLDGAWGRSSPIAPFAWPFANPWLKMRAVDGMPMPPVERPRDRSCGKPPSHLWQTRQVQHP